MREKFYFGYILDLEFLNNTNAIVNNIIPKTIRLIIPIVFHVSSILEGGFSGVPSPPG